MAALPYAFKRTFFEPDEVVICSCNYCFATIGESGNNDVLDALEEGHSCPQLRRASEAARHRATNLPSNVTAIDSLAVSVPYAFTRRYFPRDEVVISSCNRCFATVAESDDDRVLDAFELRHSCTDTPETTVRSQKVEADLLVAV